MQTVEKCKATENSGIRVSSMYLLGDRGDMKEQGHIRWGSSIFRHPDLLQNYLLFELKHSLVVIVVLYTERPLPPGETCPPNIF